MAVEEGTTETSSKPPSYRTAAAKEGEEVDRLLGAGGGSSADKGKNGKRVSFILCFANGAYEDAIL